MVSRQVIDHDERVWVINANPQVVGLDGIVLSAKEPRLFRKDHTLYHQPDSLCFDPSTHTLYNIEYKASTNHRRRAMKQLTESETTLKRMFGDWNVVNLYVHGDYEVERV